MDQPRTLDDRLAATGQLVPGDLLQVAAAGYRAVINLRPEGEAADQPAGAAIEAAARAAGLAYRHVPVRMAALSDTDVAAFRAALADLPGPVLGFCRTGTRVAALWALAGTGERPAQELLRVTDAVGFDLGEVRARIEAAGR